MALAVDLYRGKVATDPDMAHELSRGLPQDQGVQDLVAAVTYLEGRKDVKPRPHRRCWLVHGWRLRTATGHRRTRI